MVVGCPYRLYLLERNSPAPGSPNSLHFFQWLSQAWPPRNRLQSPENGINRPTFEQASPRFPGLCMVGLESTPARVGEADRFASNSSATAALPSNLSFSYRDAGIFTQAEFPREDSSTP